MMKRSQQFLVGCLFAFGLSGCRASVSPVQIATVSPSLAVVEAESDSQAATSTPVTESAEITPTSPIIPTVAQVEPTLATGEEFSGSVRGIILLIGDGMGPVQRQAAQWAAVGQNEQLTMDAMPVFGLQQTAAANRPITDSAAAATAMATGVRTNYTYIGFDPEGNRLTTILEEAQAQGWATGLVTTVPMSHATPAGFVAHVPDRYYELQIAEQMLIAGVNVLLGGGENDFLSAEYTGCYPKVGYRGDGRNLIEEAQGVGYTYVCDQVGLAGVDLQNTTHLLGLFGDEEMLEPYSPSLAEMTAAALTILSQDPDGYFLMIEGGQIDWAGHDNDAEKIIRTTLGFNAAVAQVQVFALAEPDVLVIVTGDHETGGMSLNLDGSGSSFKQDGPFNMPDGTEFFVDWATGGHTAVDIPVTAQGPYSELLMGTYPNTFIHAVMRLALFGE